MGAKINSQLSKKGGSEGDEEAAAASLNSMLLSLTSSSPSSTTAGSVTAREKTSAKSADLSDQLSAKEERSKMSRDDRKKIIGRTAERRTKKCNNAC